MRSDTQTEDSKRKGVRLSLVTSGGLFILLSMVAIGVLAVTYYSSRLVIQQEEEQIRKQTGVISSLILDRRLSYIEEFVKLISDEISTDYGVEIQSINDRLQGAFYSQEDEGVDYVSFLSEDSIQLVEVHTEFGEFPSIQEDIQNPFIRNNAWNWSVEIGVDGKADNVLIYFQQPILNKANGKVSGYLLAGIFLKDNAALLNEIHDQIGAKSTTLRLGDSVLVSVSDKDQADTRGRFDQLWGNENSYEFKLFQQRLVGADISIQSIIEVGETRSLFGLYLVSGISGFVIILVISFASVFVGRKMFLSPLSRLTEYARSVERRELNATLPDSPITELNEVGRNLQDVFQAFQRSEYRFQDFISVASDSVWETDADHKYTFVTRRSKPLYKDQGEEVFGVARWDLDNSHAVSETWEEYKKKIAKREAFKNFIFYIDGYDGERAYFSSNGKPMYDETGKFLGYRGTSTEITAEIEAQKSADEFQKQLRQSQKLEVVGQLTGGIAHDFNNLLAVVIGNLELVLEDESIGELAKKRLNDAMNGAEKGASLTHQLLAYSRQQQLEPKKVRPSTIIMEMERLLRRAIGESIDFNIRLEDSWFVMIDANELENALMNLIVNARDACEGTGEISIESFNIEIDQEYADKKLELEAGEFVCIVVSDTGTGMDEELQERIFEPFFTTKEVGKGSGLGLSMVFGFAKQSGGHVSIYSEVGKGTSFKLLLPRAEAEEATDKKENVDAVKFGDGEKILVVEDDEELRSLVKSQLQSIGYVVTTCEDAATAFEALEKGSFDLLLSDIVLPGGVSGVEIVRKSIDDYPEMSKLLMSGFPGQKFDHSKDLPVDVEVLFKPFTKVKLSNAIDVLLSGK